MTKWTQVEREIRLLLGDSSLVTLTTILDYYAFPPNAPGMIDRPNGSPADRVRHVEDALGRHVDDRRFVPHLTLHETEAWVFAAHEQLGHLYDDHALVATLRADIDAAGGPEMINDDPATAPSRRLLRYRPDYTKTLDGPLAIGELGLEKLRSQCPQLNGWLTQLES